MKRLPTIGLLPLYIKLYDDIRPQVRTEFTPFLDTIQQHFATAGVRVVRAPICCVADEFGRAIASFDAEDVDLIVAVHLAYSPSGEACEALCRSHRPLLLLDTTMDFAYGPGVDQARLMYNHGIHGVQDLASVLRRRSRPYEIVAGHVTESPVLARAAGIARAAAAREFRGTRVLRVGGEFRGMADFAVDAGTLKRLFGVDVRTLEAAALAPYVQAVSTADLEAEVQRDHELYNVTAPAAVHRNSAKVGLGLRRALEEGGYAAFSANFLGFGAASGAVNVVPFMEASKAMARGIGYAGEGDVLTANLVGALARAFGQTTFTEIFCPDWQGDTLFFSHMGEINPEIAAARPLLFEKDYIFSGAANPAVITCAPRPGPAVLANLSPGPNDSFRLILAAMEVLPDSPREEVQKMVRAWIRPPLPVPAFLEAYSRLGGTHHSALVLGASTEALAAAARFLGLEASVIG